MAREADVHSVFGEIHAIGLSAPVSLSAAAGQCAVTFKLLSGGTLAIGGALNTVSPAGITQTWGNLYLMGTSEVMNMANAGKFYLYASGATCTIAVLRGLTDGV